MHLSNSCANPWAVVVKALYAVVIDATMVGSWRLVEVASVIVSRNDAVVVHNHLLCPAKHGHQRVILVERGVCRAVLKHESFLVLFNPPHTEGTCS